MSNFFHDFKSWLITVQDDDMIHSPAFGFDLLASNTKELNCLLLLLLFSCTIHCLFVSPSVFLSSQELLLVHGLDPHPEEEDGDERDDQDHQEGDGDADKGRRVDAQ